MLSHKPPGYNELNSPMALLRRLCLLVLQSDPELPGSNFSAVSSLVSYGRGPLPKVNPGRLAPEYGGEFSSWFLASFQREKVSKQLSAGQASWYYTSCH